MNRLDRAAAPGKDFLAAYTAVNAVAVETEDRGHFLAAYTAVNKLDFVLRLIDHFLAAYTAVNP
ncbi:hypothetical protein [Pseudomonas aeruginosa]|uniref:hypothetical protein n=1 Tax=Pseudomonas aeruginosa TaxID=287 RepID=UPI0039184CB9